MTPEPGFRPAVFMKSGLERFDNLVIQPYISLDKYRGNKVTKMKICWRCIGGISWERLVFCFFSLHLPGRIRFASQSPQHKRIRAGLGL